MSAPQDASSVVATGIAAQRPRATGDRIHYLDWLRSSAVLIVVVYHALLPFTGLPWHVRDAETADVLALLAVPLPFAFALFFLIAGAGARHALLARPVRRFLVERAGRLLVPFAVGCVVLAVPTSYLIARLDGTWSDSFAAYVAAVPGMLARIVNTVGPRPAVLPIATMHLWFLAWLFLFCLIASPVFVFLSTPSGDRIVAWIARAARHRGATVLFAGPLALIALPLFGVSSAAAWDWAAFGLWGGVFVGGYVMFSDERLVAAARRDLLPSFIAAMLGLAGLAITGFTDEVFLGGGHRYDATYLLVVTSQAVATWGVTLTVLGAAMRVGFMQRPLARAVNDAALAIYVLHFPVVIAISAVVVRSPLGLWPKVALNVGLGVVVTLVVVSIAVRILVVRRLIGLPRAVPERTGSVRRRARPEVGPTPA